jgi:hypothetical protein
MPSTYSSNLKLELMATGENSGTWGNITNTNLGTAVEQAIIGLGNVDYVSDANLTISITNSNAAQAARALVLNVTSSLSLTNTRELVVPTIEKQYIVQNNTTGGQSITVKTSAGTGITVPNGRKAHLYVNGTNVIQMFDFVDINGGTIDGTPIGGSSAAAGSFTTLGASGAATFNGAVTLGDAAADLIVFNGTVNSHLLFTDNTYDIGASGATRPRNLFLAGNATVGGNLSVGGTLTLTGGVNLNGNVTVGDSSADTLTINSTITSNLLFTDNTYDIGASGATRPRNLFLAGNATIGGNTTMTGSLTVDSTTDSSSTTTGSIQTDGGLGVAKALYVGTTVNVGGLTSGRVTYATTSGRLTDSANLLYSGTDLTVYGITVGRGAGAVSTNTAVGASALAANTTGARNTAVGYIAFNANTTGAENTAVGYGALDANTTGNENNAFGSDALGSNTTGISNSAFGSAALRANTTASDNSGLGYATLLVNTTGAYNTAVGSRALFSNTTASNNTAVGYQAGYSTTTGANNTFVGSLAGYSNTTGDFCTAVGWESLKANTTGRNTAYGIRSLLANTTGTANTALGDNAMGVNTTGNNNVAVGYSALEKNTTASANTAVGYQAGFSNTTGSALVAVGYQAAYANTTGVYNVAIGQIALFGNQTGSSNIAVGWGANRTGTGGSNVNIGTASGYDMTTGANNIGIGDNALRYISSGSFNVGIGTQALQANTTASNNTAVGYQAGYSNTTGTNNTALGIGALYSNGTTSGNTALGASSLAFTTSGTNNTAVGYNAGNLLTTGSKNTILGGYNGNQGGLDIRTADNYIVLSDGDGNPRVVVDGGGFGGIGVNPANQYAASGGASWQVGRSTNIWNYSVSGNDQTRIYNNAYIDTSAGERYLNTNRASKMQMADGRFFVQSAPSGSAGALATFTSVLDVSLNETLALQGATSQSGTGITFPATQSASSNANTLDDYERGTWTPTFTNLTIGNGSVWGTYVKIGRQVTVNFGFNFGSTSSFSGGITSITGLPFATETTGQHVAVASFLKQGSGWYTGSVAGQNTSLQHLSVSGGNSVVGATNPFTWAANDYAAITLTYITPA